MYFKKWPKILSNSSIIAIIVIIVNLLSYFTAVRTSITTWLKNLGVSNPTLLDLLAIILIGLLVFLLVSVFSYVWGRVYKSKLINYEGTVISVLSSDASGNRITDFQTLRSQAKESIIVMGIGMTYFSSDLAYLEKLLEQRRNIRLLMILPEILVPSIKEIPEESNYKIFMTNDGFEAYFDRHGYSRDVYTSFERLNHFIDERKKNPHRQGSIQFRSFPYMIPINVTAIDETKRSKNKLIAEFCLPFSDNRIRIKLSHDDEMSKLILESLENIWEHSIKVNDDQR